MKIEPRNTFVARALQSDDSIRLLIVDDQKFIRAQIKSILATQERLDVIGTANDGEQAISQIKALRPDVVLMDIEMPKMDGIEVTKIIARQFPETKILVLSTHEKEEYIQKIIGAGADGYILKQTPALELTVAIHAVHKGYSHFGPNILKKIKVEVDNRATDSTPIDNCALNRQAVEMVRSRTNSYPSRNSPQNSSLPTAQVEEFLPSIEHWLTWGGVLIIIILSAALPLSSILKYKTKVKAPATIRPQGEVRLVQAQIAGQISAILLKSGDRVEQGDIIAQVNSSRLETQQRQLQQGISQQELQLTQLDSQLISLEQQIVAETQRNHSEIKAAEARLATSIRNHQERKVEVRSQYTEALANLKATQTILATAESKLSRYQFAAAEGALSQGQLTEAKLEVTRQQQELAAVQARLKTIEATLNPSDAEITLAQQNIAQAQKNGQVNIASLNREKKAILQQRASIEQQLKQDHESFRQTTIDLEKALIKATASGEISRLELRNPGQRVQQGQEIAQILPSNAALEIRVLTSPQNISQLEQGQEVQVRISACPYPDYGTLQGKVSRLAKDISPVGNATLSSTAKFKPQDTATYEVFVEPEARTFGRQENQCLLQSGMEGTAEIITREETVLQFLLRKARLVSNI